MTQRNPLADPLARFEWEVAAGGHEWIVLRWGKKLVAALTPHVDQPRPPRLVYPFTKKNAGLFQRFASLPRTTDAILSFANDYGLLGPPIRQQFDSSKSGRVYEVVRLPGVYRREPQYPQKSHSWLAQIQLMREFLDFSEGTPGRQRMTLKDRVNTALRETCAPVLDWTEEHTGQPQFRLDWQPRSLLGALWLQAARSVDDKSFRPCMSCGGLMEISRAETTGKKSHSRFCSDKCRVRGYRQRKRQAVQLAQQGWTPARIAKDLGSTTATVRGWLKKKRWKGGSRGVQTQR